MLDSDVVDEIIGGVNVAVSEGVRNIESVSLRLASSFDGDEPVLKHALVIRTSSDAEALSSLTALLRENYRYGIKGAGTGYVDITIPFNAKGNETSFFNLTEDLIRKNLLSPETQQALIKVFARAILRHLPIGGSQRIVSDIVENGLNYQNAKNLVALLASPNNEVLRLFHHFFEGLIVDALYEFSRAVQQPVDIGIFSPNFSSIAIQLFDKDKAGLIVNSYALVLGMEGKKDSHLKALMTALSEDPKIAFVPKWLENGAILLVLPFNGSTKATNFHDVMTLLISKGMISENTRTALIQQFAETTYPNLTDNKQQEVITSIIDNGFKTGNVFILNTWKNNVSSSELEAFMDYLGSTIDAVKSPAQLGLEISQDINKMNGYEC